MVPDRTERPTVGQRRIGVDGAGKNGTVVYRPDPESRDVGVAVGIDRTDTNKWEREEANPIWDYLIFGRVETRPAKRERRGPLAR